MLALNRSGLESGAGEDPMALTRRAVMAGFLGAAATGARPGRLAALGARPGAEAVLNDWIRLGLELVRHTPTYTPPVASRAFALLGVTAFETIACGRSDLRTLAGQVQGLDPLPRAHADHDPAIAMQAAMALVTRKLFHNTGPTGQRAMAAMERVLAGRVAEGVPQDRVAASMAIGESIASHVTACAADDGGAEITNLGFTGGFAIPEGPQYWVPTSTIALQQAPLLPNWGRNRPFATYTVERCASPGHPPYSEELGSAFHAEAMEVYETVRDLTPEQETIARFWADDAMLSFTPPGHWIAIALQIAERDSFDAARAAELYARLGIAMADGFIACWHDKYAYNLVRPVTYIRRVINPSFNPILTTPPFPEYPSGHSVQSGAAAEALTALLGEDFAFTDVSGEAEGFAPRHYASFWEAAHEAGLSRLYGGIHFRSAITHGLEQGRCIGAHAAALRTRT
jgi:hypothetical protein